VQRGERLGAINRAPTVLGTACKICEIVGGGGGVQRGERLGAINRAPTVLDTSCKICEIVGGGGGVMLHFAVKNGRL